MVLPLVSASGLTVARTERATWGVVAEAAVWGHLGGLVEGEAGVEVEVEGAVGVDVTVDGVPLSRYDLAVTSGGMKCWWWLLGRGRRCSLVL